MFSLFLKKVQNVSHKISFNKCNTNNSDDEVLSGVARCGVVEYNYNHLVIIIYPTRNNISEVGRRRESFSC